MKGKVIGIEGNEVDGNEPSVGVVGGRDGIMGNGGTFTPLGGKGGNIVGLGKVGRVDKYGKVGLCKRLLRAPMVKLMLENARARRKYVMNNFLEAMAK
ncbi:hypothetical protein TanjilG_14871 [Lupinus angustifolius]|uniref:Uncharacterized protein n=1 Tax=Lupinus angustifolius TaxID=3871 RepID=A0A1J7H706_LUPAN|nr:hypothetical protein TanjilG_14871 [Lupinus angustifolius]